MANEYSNDWFDLFLESAGGAQTELEAAFVRQLLPPSEAGALLDVPCGAGRHAAHFARMGYRIVGVDREPGLIARARREAPGARFEVMDMAEVRALGERFASIVCLWQSFGMGTDEENRRLLEAWAGVIVPGGVLVLDIYDPAFFPSRLTARETERKGVLVREEKRLYDGRLEVRLRYGTGREDVFDWRLYSCEELARVGRSAGFRLERSYANFDLGKGPAGEYPRAQHLLVRE